MIKPYKTIVLLAAFMLGLFLSIKPASAGFDIFDTTVSTCTTLNCSQVVFGGTVHAFGPSANQWDAHVFAAPGECVRIALTSEFTDLETVVRAPNGTVFRNDDGFVAPCALCPVVKFSAPNNGWYAVSIAHFAGTAVEGNFTFTYGRYTPGNPNCAAPTPPLSPQTSEPSAKPRVGLEKQPPLDAPGQ
jgi:hypothetical protein